jgi:hypothetical protein
MTTSLSICNLFCNDFFFSCDLPTLDARESSCGADFPKRTLAQWGPDMAQLQVHNYAEKKTKKRDFNKVTREAITG